MRSEYISRLIKNYKDLLNDGFFSVTSTQENILKDRIKLLNLVLEGSKEVGSKDKTIISPTVKESHLPSEKPMKKPRGSPIKEQAFKLFNDGKTTQEVHEKLGITLKSSYQHKYKWRKERDLKNSFLHGNKNPIKRPKKKENKDIAKEEEEFEHSMSDF